MTRTSSLAGEIAWHEAEIARLQRQRRDETDARLLRALTIATRGCVFSVADIFTRATLDPDLAAAVGDLSPKALGKRLARCLDRDLEGVTVRRVVVSRGAWLWELHITPEAGASS